ncbi:O-acyltransferase WSD1-like, partial [Panicum virgatum]
KVVIILVWFFFLYYEKACLNMIESGKGSDVKWGNELGFIILPFHICLHDDPLQYVRKAKKIVDRKKSSLEVVLTHLAAEVILKIIGLKAAGAIFHRMISHTTISFSNMIDPVEQVEFCGHPVVFIAPSGFGPPEDLTVNFQSYVNTMMVNLAVDEAQFPDCHELLDDFVESLRLIRGAASNFVKNHKKG